MAIKIGTGARDAATNGIVDRLDAGAGAGIVRVYTGAPPATPQAAVTGTLLVAFVLSDPAFGAASAGVATGSGLPKTGTGLAAGTAGWFRAVDSDGTGVWQGTVTATGGGGDMTMDTTTVSVGLTVNLTALSYTTPEGA